MLRDWLESRDPPPPPRLARRLAAALSSSRESAPNATPGALVTAAAGILERMMADEPEAKADEQPARAAALDLLAADALITYALEAAAEGCESFAAAADAMTARLAALADDAS